MDEIKFDIEKEFLPVGSVVSVRFNTNKFMIVGFCTVAGDSKKMYDYSAVAYPLGLMDFDNVTMFNKEIIKKVHYLGYSDEEEKEFKKTLAEAIKNKKFRNFEEMN